MTAAPAPNPLAGRSLRAPVLYGSLPLIEHDDRTVAPRLGRSQPPHVLNQLWPPGSRWILDQRRRIAVWARIVWADDGEQWVHGHGSRWTSRHVFVEVDDPRLATLGVWVTPADVRRR